jgi:hypothetical protein
MILKERDHCHVYYSDILLQLRKTLASQTALKVGQPYP